MKPYSVWKIEYLNWKSSFIRAAITEVSRLLQTDTKSLLLKVSAKRAIRKQADKQVTKVIIWLWRTLTVLNGFILHTASIALTGRTAPICA